MRLRITQEDSNLAMKFADETVDNTYNRMKYNNTPAGRKQRVSKIYVGKIAEEVVCRYLREELKLEITGNTSEGEPDEFDFSFEHQNQPFIGDVKSFHVFRTWQNRTRIPEQVERDSSALIPVDQFKGQRKDLYIFTIILGDINPDTGYMDLSSTDTGICFTHWATDTDIDTWDFIPRGKSVFPYYGTRTDNYGQKMSECRIMENFYRGPVH
jgi:hypothetical protein